MSNSNSIKKDLLKVTQQTNSAIFNAAAKNAVFFAFDVTKAIIENATPVIYITGENSSVSNIRFSAQIIELTLPLMNDNNIKKVNIPPQTDGSTIQTNVSFCRCKLLPLLFL